jgi:tyrosine-protein phosphatase SIW14
LKAMGVRTVIDLRSSNGEREAVEAAGMRSVEIPMNVMKNVDPEAARKALSVMTDPANQPFFDHCQHGKDRTGLVAAVHRTPRGSQPEAARKFIGGWRFGG